MKNLEKLCFRARATAEGLHLRVRFDGKEIFSKHLDQDAIDVSHEFDDAIETHHRLEIEMSGKTRQHTRVDSSGKIIEDRWIEISEFKLCDIELGYILNSNSVYEHDTNGTTEPRQDKFFGIMGCNGVVKLDFFSPAYIWLLENM